MARHRMYAGRMIPMRPEPPRRRAPLSQRSLIELQDLQTWPRQYAAGLAAAEATNSVPATVAALTATSAAATGVDPALLDGPTSAQLLQPGTDRRERMRAAYQDMLAPGFEAALGRYMQDQEFIARGGFKPVRWVAGLDLEDRAGSDPNNQPAS